MATKVYTKTGDNGITTLLGGTKVPKDDWRLDAYGTVDELNSFVGLLIEELWDIVNKTNFSQSIDKLEIIQDTLFKIGSVLSYDNLGKIRLNLPSVGENEISQLEEWIDEMDAELPELKNFILPRGNKSIATCHVCRTISRRAERRCVQAIQYPLILKYLNRLSDFFFVLSRFISIETKIQETIWKS